jgi:hypothetical protein
MRTQRADTIATRLMGALFGVGAACFVVGPLDAYASRVGANADAVTFFVGSILFTSGGLTQSWLAYPERGTHRAGLLAWRAAWIQSIGTLFFNFMTFEAISLAPSDTQYNALVWVPNALGSVCFLISGVLLYISSPRAGWRPLRPAPGWWEPPMNLLGCVLFGISAVAGFAITSTGELLNLATANWTTTFGAACFLAVGLAALIAGMSFKIPRLSRLVAFERALRREFAAAERGVEKAGRVIEADVITVEHDSEHEIVRVERLVEREFRAEPEID